MTPQGGFGSENLSRNLLVWSVDTVLCDSLNRSGWNASKPRIKNHDAGRFAAYFRPTILA